MVISFLYSGTMFITSGIRNSLMSKFYMFIIFHISYSCRGTIFFGADPIYVGIDMTLSFVQEIGTKFGGGGGGGGGEFTCFT